MVGDIFQPTHLLFVLVVALLVLGPKRLPEVGRSLGRTMRDFRAALSGEHNQEPAIAETTPPDPAVTAPAPAAAEPQSEGAEAGAAEASAEATAEQKSEPTERQPTAAR